MSIDPQPGDILSFDFARMSIVEDYLRGNQEDDQ